VIESEGERILKIDRHLEKVMGKSLVSCVIDLCTRSFYFHVGGSSAVSVALLSCLAVSPAPFMDFFLNECNR